MRADTCSKVTRQSTEAYLRALQAAARHHLRIHTLLSRRNAAALEIYSALVNRRGILDTLQQESAKLLCAPADAKKRGRNDKKSSAKTNAAPVNRVSPPMLLVSLNKELEQEKGGAEKLVIVVGTQLSTPFGAAVVSAINLPVPPATATMLTLQLSFGISYVPLSTVLTWIHAGGVDQCSRSAVLAKLQQEALTLPADVQAKMNALLSVNVEKHDATSTPVLSHKDESSDRYVYLNDIISFFM